MFIIDGVYRNVDISGLSAPILEGTVLTETGAIASADGSDAFGIVSQTIHEIPPTKLASVVVGGTIDLRSQANANVEFSEAVMKALGADINFVQNSEAAEGGGGGGSSLPAYSSSDIGKVLTLGEGSDSETVTIVPEQTVTFSDEPVLLTNVNENAFQNLTPGETANAVINGVSYVATSFDLEGTVAYGVSLDPDTTLFIAYSEEMEGVVLTGDAPGTYTISLTGLVPKAEPKWEVGSSGIQIIRPLKIKDLPPVPQGLTPKADYHMDEPEAYAPVYFLVGDHPSDDFTPVVANAGSNVVYAVSYFEMEMDDANILFLTPSSLVNGIPSQLEKPGDVETSSIAAITADTLPIQVIPASACERFLRTDIVVINVSTIQWFKFPDK